MYKLSLEIPEGTFDFAKFKQDYPDTEIEIYTDQLPVVTFTTVTIPTAPTWENVQNISAYLDVLANLFPEYKSSIEEIRNSTSCREYLDRIKDINKDYNAWVFSTTELTRKYEAIVSSYQLK